MFKIDKQTQIIFFVLALIFFIVGLFYFYEILQSRVVVKKYASGEVVKEKKDDGLVTVYVCGEVNCPGVYALKENARVKDALALAKGARAGADLTKVNLAAYLSDEDKIYVPAKKKKTIKQARKTRKTKSARPRYKTYYDSEKSIQSPPQPLEDADILIQEGIVEVKVNGRIKK